MTIERGKRWGEHGPLPDDAVLVRSDTEARGVVEEARRKAQAPPALGLLGGDLCRTLGGVGDEARLRSAEALRVPIDIGSVLVDGRQYWFVAHLVARRSWWWGRLVAVMNAQWLGRWDVAPRAHPNDGLLDTYDATLSIRDRLEARRRLPAGAHLPHPRIKQRRTAAFQISLARPTPVYLDGQPVALARNLAVRVEPDAIECVV